MSFTSDAEVMWGSRPRLNFFSETIHSGVFLDSCPRLFFYKVSTGASIKQIFMLIPRMILFFPKNVPACARDSFYVWYVYSKYVCWLLSMPRDKNEDDTRPGGWFENMKRG